MDPLMFDNSMKAGRREWLGLAVLALPCLVMVMDFTILTLAVPTLTQDLQPTPTQLLWIVDVYGFLVAGLLITMGNIGDRIGRRRLLLIGGACFGIASMLAAFSTSAEMLITARAILGLAGATLAPSTLALIRSMFHDGAQRARAISIWASTFAAGGVMGPVVAGVMLRYFWWGSAFLIAVPVMAALVLAGPRLLPEFRDPSQGRVDLFSAGLSLAAVLSFIYGLKHFAQAGLAWSGVEFVVIGLVIGAVFVRRQARLDHPLIDLALFRAPRFASTLAVLAASAFVMFGASFYVAQYLQFVLGLSPLQAGLCLAPATAAVIVGAQLAPSLARRFDDTVIMAAGLGVSAVGFALLTQVDAHDLPLLVASYFTMSLGVGPLTAICPGLIVGTAPPERAGAAASLSSTSAEFGGALGLAMLGSLGVAVYRVALAMPPGLSAGAAASTHDSLGTALQASTHLPPLAGAGVVAAARDAFTTAFVVVAAVCRGPGRDDGRSSDRLASLGAAHDHGRRPRA